MKTMLQLADQDGPAGLLLWNPTEAAHTKVETEVFSAPDPTLNVLTLYSASLAAEHSRFSGFLQDLLGIYCETRVSPLSFEEFENRPPTIEASDIVVLIASDEGEAVPPKVRKWLSSWLTQAGGDSAVVCLLARGTYREQGTWHGVHRACDAAGVAFFATGFEPNGSSGLSRFAPSELRLPGDDFSCGVAHWGINE